MRIARGISVTNTSKPISTAIVYDADAAAFFTAASITDNTQKSAVNQLVLDLKSASIWTKMKALYPVVGGVASAHAVNLKQPGTYNLSFATGWTHTSTGMTPNGATYADSFFNPRNNATLYNEHLSYYSRTQIATGINTDMGAFQNAVPNVYVNSLAILRNDGISVANINSNDFTRLTPSETDGRGFFIISRTASNSLKLYKNSAIKATNTTTTSLINPNYQITLGALNLDGGLAQYSNKQCAFASIGDGLTDAEASSFYNAVQTYQTTLGRQV